MHIDQLSIKHFMEKAGQANPEKPCIPDAETRMLRVRLLLEEVLELAEASGVGVFSAKDHTVEFEKDDIGVFVKEKTTPDIVGVADALADIKYVGEGAAVSWGIDLEPIFNEVHASNMTKFIDGHRREDGKWIKGPSYRPANLKPLIEAQQR